MQMQTRGLGSHKEGGVVLSGSFHLRCQYPAVNTFLSGAGLRIFEMAIGIRIRRIAIGD